MLHHDTVLKCYYKRSRQRWPWGSLNLRKTKSLQRGKGSQADGASLQNFNVNYPWLPLNTNTGWSFEISLRLPLFLPAAQGFIPIYIDIITVCVI